MKKSDQKEVTTEASNPSELDLLKQEATEAGIEFHPNIGMKKLIEKISKSATDKAVAEAIAKTEAKAEMKAEIAAQVATQTNAATRQPAAAAVPTKMTRYQQMQKVVKEATRLVRIRVSCMNPNKTEWPGEIFTASNSVIPTQKKFVPFNTEEPWHVPKIILNIMKERKCQVFRTVKRSDGKKVREGYLIPEFAIEEIAPITSAELQELKSQQALANNIG
jgi:hypothetical protein